ncbi:cob(I)yrinic acid a,c-diamide adenosyltransferase [Pueribacillus sp. YX66]|uniref:cob(I)yrinic acid a,c-diamide adenosyltransferase n=1 Tax=Pueribacillus sp. YX66 TaxID=3229242 RepID=UPI00358D78EA
MKIYTRTGDKGKTSLIGGRVDKDHIRVQAYGTIDEANSFVGQAIAELDPNQFQDLINELEKIQHELFDCGGDLANVTGKGELKLKQEMIDFLEERIDEYIEETPELQRFILPGGVKPAALIHVARTVTRRAEREVVTLAKAEEHVPPLVQMYLNRLSDYFFVLARVINFRSGKKDIEYERSAIVFRSNRRKKKEGE